MNLKIFGIPIKYIFSRKKIKSYLVGTAIGDKIKESYFKQVMMRYNHPGCRECVKKGKCVHCGCKTWEKMLDPGAICYGPYPEDGDKMYWGPMLSDKGFKDVDNIHGIEFKTIYTKSNEPDK